MQVSGEQLKSIVKDLGALKKIHDACVKLTAKFDDLDSASKVDDLKDQYDDFLKRVKVMKAGVTEAERYENLRKALTGEMRSAPKLLKALTAESKNAGGMQTKLNGKVKKWCQTKGFLNKLEKAITEVESVGPNAAAGWRKVGKLFDFRDGKASDYRIVAWVNAGTFCIDGVYKHENPGKGFVEGKRVSGY